MAVLKLAAFPAALGLASFRVYAMTEKKTDDMISPRELSIYNPESPVAQYVEEQPGRLQTGLGRVRVGLQPYVRTVQNGCTSVKIGVTSLYQSGQDMYEFLRDPPPGFLPRVGVITVSGLAGLILARKGSRVKRIGFPLALTTVGAAMCYPRETVGILKVCALLKNRLKKAELVLEVASEEVAPAVDTSAVDEVLSSSAPLLAEPALEAAPEQDSETEACHEPTHVAEFAPVFEGSKPAAEVAEVALEALDPAVSELAPIETETTPAVSLPAEEHPTFSLSELKNPEEEDVSLSPPPADIADTAPALEENIALPSALPPTDKETTLCPSTTDKIVSVPPPVIDQPTLIAATVQQTTSSTPAAENTPTALAEGQTTPPSFATEDTTSPLSDVGEAKSPPPTEEETTSLAAAEPISALNPDSVKVKPRFVPDPSLVDHGQAHPEDADMYSTRG
uniref:MICOS complex subunit n=1 Tax=Astyanax mexicanus TaxID=7994 RepID=A0A3B1JIP7_ASTMX